eukprot:TRINITY_DN16020_c0_g1_i4.p1 TRINITY_DN16020_c0_g1~~TRINITY_DN16020_c0_g1_i4.p1  ORF type:complete len:418 (+),score=105.32 TRINITY_DN16020_c0_g1_i4:48-1256(+)
MPRHDAMYVGVRVLDTENFRPELEDGVTPFLFASIGHSQPAPYEERQRICVVRLSDAGRPLFHLPGGGPARGRGDFDLQVLDPETERLHLVLAGLRRLRTEDTEMLGSGSKALSELFVRKETCKINVQLADKGHEIGVILQLEPKGFGVGMNRWSVLPLLPPIVVRELDVAMAPRFHCEPVTQLPPEVGPEVRDQFCAELRESMKRDASMAWSPPIVKFAKIEVSSEFLQAFTWRFRQHRESRLRIRNLDDGSEVLFAAVPSFWHVARNFDQLRRENPRPAAEILATEWVAIVRNAGDVNVKGQVIAGGLHGGYRVRFEGQESTFKRVSLWSKRDILMVQREEAHGDGKGRKDGEMLTFNAEDWKVILKEWNKLVLDQVQDINRTGVRVHAYQHLPELQHTE